MLSRQNYAISSRLRDDLVLYGASICISWLGEGWLCPCSVPTVQLCWRCLMRKKPFSHSDEIQGLLRVEDLSTEQLDWWLNEIGHPQWIINLLLTMLILSSIWSNWNRLGRAVVRITVGQISNQVTVSEQMQTSHQMISEPFHWWSRYLKINQTSTSP